MQSSKAKRKEAETVRRLRRSVEEDVKSEEPDEAVATTIASDVPRTAADARSVG